MELAADTTRAMVHKVTMHAESGAATIEPGTTSGVIDPKWCMTIGVLAKHAMEPTISPANPASTTERRRACHDPDGSGGPGHRVDPGGLCGDR